MLRDEVSGGFACEATTDLRSELLDYTRVWQAPGMSGFHQRGLIPSSLRVSSA